MIKIDRNNTNFSMRLFEYLRNLNFNNEGSAKYAFLKYYQNVLRVFTTEVDTGSRGLLINFTMGMGKSIMAVALAFEMLDLADNKHVSGTAPPKIRRQPIILLTKSLQENMRGAIVKYVKLRGQHDPLFPLARLGPRDLDDWINRKFSFVSMNASNMLKQMTRAAEGNSAAEFDAMLEKKLGDVVKMSNLDNKLLIVDEAHNFFRAITNGSKNALGVYELVMKARNIKVIFLTGTPISNDPFELVPCFNMLGSAGPDYPLLPENYKDFYNLFVDANTGHIKNKEKFQNRIMGLVSYVTHTSNIGAKAADPSAVGKASAVEFPEKLPTIIERVPMAPEQYVAYQLARDKEHDESSRGPSSSGGDIPNMQKPKGRKSSYRVRSRQLSNFYYNPGVAIDDMKKHLDQIIPDGTDESIDDEEGLTTSKSDHNVSDKSREEKINLTKKLTGMSISDIPDSAITSPKFEAMYKNIVKRGDTLGLVYSQFVGAGGLGTFARFLDLHGYKQRIVEVAKPTKSKEALIQLETASDSQGELDEIAEEIIEDHSEMLGDVNGGKVNGGNDIGQEVWDRWLDNNQSLIDASAEYSLVGALEGGDDSETAPEPKKSASQGRQKYYAIISGAVPIEVRAALMDLYNSDENMHGGVIDLLLISSTGAEGLDLKNTRHIHIMEPYWNWPRIAQVEARGIRNDSHLALPPNEKNVQTYIYLSVAPKGLTDSRDPLTTDEQLYNDSVKVQTSVSSFTETLHEVSIECMLNDGKNCKTCHPSDQPLFTRDILRDMKSMDPCQPAKEQKVTVQEIIVKGVSDGTPSGTPDGKFYYRENPNSVFDYDIFVFDAAINSYKKLREDDPRCEKIADAIESLKK